MERSDGQGSGIHIGRVEGSAFAVGDNNTVTNTNRRDSGAETDPAQEQLLQAVRELRTDLARMVTNQQTDALDAELAETEGEIEQSGSASRGRLTRLRQALADADSVTAILASGATVSQSVAALLGG